MYKFPEEFIDSILNGKAKEIEYLPNSHTIEMCNEILKIPTEVYYKSKDIYKDNNIRLYDLKYSNIVIHVLLTFRPFSRKILSKKEFFLKLMEIKL